ncbi:MAG TPA: hypothetical protein VFP58_10315, partial [Candidatus Eisenbacteria bacterium]|nr:hypothetical protein [Candidatus Eisenbacteria bacterium]
AADSGEMWLVLYNKDGTCRAETRPIRVEACEYMEGGGKCVSSDVSDSVVFFVKGLRAPKDGFVLAVRDAQRLLYPGQEASFRLPDGEWSRILALGAAKEVRAGYEIVKVFEDYRLVFSRGPGLRYRQVIGPFVFDSESHPPTIEWAGDLDQDGHLDFLIEKSRFNHVEWDLYLSSKARSPALLELVASLQHSGC